MQEINQASTYLGWFIGIVLFPAIQIGKKKTWWPGTKRGNPWDPRPVLFVASFAILVGFAYFFNDQLTIAQLKGMTGDVLTEAAKATTGGVLLHYGWQKFRGLLGAK